MAGAGVDDLKKLQQENGALKEEVARLKRELKDHVEDVATVIEPPVNEVKGVLSIIVFGASGDLAFKKTYPALFSLYIHGLLPPVFQVAGFARSKMSEHAFRLRISEKFPKGHDAQKAEFLSRCWYGDGQYNSAESVASFTKIVHQHESKLLGDSKEGAHRLFYLAVPPSIFVATCASIKAAGLSESGWNRIVVEKPFGRDLESSHLLARELGALYREEQIYRIDHYLGKEMVQNLMVLRFANSVYEPVWNRYYIKSVLILFKEDFGCQGRGGYFDEFGIIRDVMQNHLLQILSLVAMEPPLSLSAEDVRNEKVRLLRAIAPASMDHTVVGQYGPDPKGREPAYIDDPTVPKSSVTPTYAATVLNINNLRWFKVPFILVAGKALDERKAEVRIQFRKPELPLFPTKLVGRNELVLRVQPDESVFFKMTIKMPGLTSELIERKQDLSYKASFGGVAIPDAYERLLYDVIRGDHNLFVRRDELIAAWKIFTPLLHQIESKSIAPVLYDYGSRGPPQGLELLVKHGYDFGDIAPLRLRPGQGLAPGSKPVQEAAKQDGQEVAKQDADPSKK